MSRDSVRGATRPSKSPELRPAQCRILRHMLGIDDPYMAKPKPYRDYYCANPGDVDLHELAELGMVELYATRGSYEWFRCTAAGRGAAFASHKTIRKSKAARVYAKFLDVRECFPDLTFRQFLTDTQFLDTRRTA